MIYLANAFSVTMLRYPHVGVKHRLTVERISAREAGAILRGNEFVSVFGHPETAGFLGKYLHVYVPCSRDSIQLGPEDVVIVARAAMTREYREQRRKAPKWTFFRVKMCEKV